MIPRIVFGPGRMRSGGLCCLIEVSQEVEKGIEGNEGIAEQGSLTLTIHDTSSPK